MTFSVKSIFALGLCAGGLFLTACDSDDDYNPISDGFELNKPFDVVLEKAQYAYKSKDSSMIFKRAVCEEGSLGNLVWKKVGENPDTVSAYLTKKTAVLRYSEKDIEKFSFNGSKFPVGSWTDPDYAKNPIENALKFSSDGMLNYVFSYSGSCFMKDVYAQFRSENNALQEADSVLTNFYMSFKPSRDTVLNEKQMMRDIRVATCNEMTLYNGLVKIRMDEINESKGRLNVSFKGDSLAYSCDISYKFRYKFSESDCKAAHEEFLVDKYANEEFIFEDYWKSVEYNEYCIAKLIIALKEDQGISLKKSAEEVDTRTFAKGVVDVLFSKIK